MPETVQYCLVRKVACYHGNGMVTGEIQTLATNRDIEGILAVRSLYPKEEWDGDCNIQHVIFSVRSNKRYEINVD
jgi:hypothetical protein